MVLAARRIIQTIAKRNRSMKTDGAGGRAAKAGRRLTCIGKDMLGYPGASQPSQAIDEENYGALFIITSAKQDRDGDVVRPEGIWLEEFKRNPVWFWNHQEEPLPIGTGWHPQTGKAMIWFEKGLIYAWCYFDSEDPFAMKIFRKVKRKFISMCSIGFVPLEMNHLRDKANHDNLGQSGGYDVARSELVEVSITGVGSNRNAFLVGRSCSPQRRAEYGAKMKNRIKNLPTRPIKKAAEPEKPKEPVDKSAQDVQHVALSKQKFPDQAQAVEFMSKQGLATDNVEETETDWQFHQFPGEELAESGAYEDLDDGVRAFVGQRAMEPEVEDTDVVTESVDTPEETVDETPLDDTPMKPGAQIAMNYIADITSCLAIQEDEDLIPLLQDFLDELKKYAKSKHPDLDLYDDSDEVVDTPTEVDPDAPVDDPEEDFEPYKHTRRLRTKGMSRRTMKAIEAAADHLDDIAADDFSDQKRLRAIKTCSSYHSKELRGMVKSPDMDDEPEAVSKGLKVVSLADDLELINKAASGYDRVSKRAFGS